MILIPNLRKRLLAVAAVGAVAGAATVYSRLPARAPDASVPLKGASAVSPERYKESARAALEAFRPGSEEAARAALSALLALPVPKESMDDHFAAAAALGSYAAALGSGQSAQAEAALARLAALSEKEPWLGLKLN